MPIQMWTIRDRTSGKYYHFKNQSNPCVWVDYESATVYSHPYYAWGAVKLLNLDPSAIEVIRVTVCNAEQN